MALKKQDPYFMTKVKIAGIPCFIDVEYSAGYSAKTKGDPHDCYEGANDEFEFEVYDLKGYRAKWLEEKVDDKVYKDVFEQWKKQSERNDY